MAVMAAEVVGLHTGKQAACIPALAHEDAPSLARAEFERLLALLETLDGDDWARPTYCTQWNVREMTAHLAGAVAGYATWSEFVRQVVANPYVRSEKVPVDGINRRQLEDRIDRSPTELVEEFRQAGPKAISVRHQIPWPLRTIPVLHGEPVSDASLRYLLDVVYTRDWWMHRYDICAATGKEMTVDAAHDGRMVDLIVRDVAHVLQDNGLAERSLLLELDGAAGGAYLFGPDAQPDTVLRMDLFTFALRTSGRISPLEAYRRIAVDGDTTKVEWFLQNCEVLY